MRKLALLALPVALAGLVVPPAHAATTQIGNGCLANTAPGAYTLLMTGKSGANPLPIAAPSAGVITKATFNMPNIGPTVYPQILKSLRSTGAANQYTVVAESASIPVGSNPQTYNVRVPIAAGDLIGLYGPSGTLACQGAPAGDTIGASAPNVNVTPGQTATFTPVPSYALPVVASIEPDADHDGYGDDTQDLCPQSATTQAACPVAHLDSSATAERGFIKMVVSTDVATKVKVTGKVRVHGRTIKLKGGTKTIAAGGLGKFKVRYPSALKAALATMRPGQTLKVKLVATATNIAGPPSVTKETVRIHGTKH